MVGASPRATGPVGCIAGPASIALSRARRASGARISTASSRSSSRQAVANSVTTKAAPITQAMWGAAAPTRGSGRRAARASRRDRRRTASASGSAPVVNALTPSSWAAPPSRSMLCAGCSTNRRGESPRAASGVAPETCPTHCSAGRAAATSAIARSGTVSSTTSASAAMRRVALEARDVPRGGRTVTDGMSGTAGSDEHDVHGVVVPLREGWSPRRKATNPRPGYQTRLVRSSMCFAPRLAGSISPNCSPPWRTRRPLTPWTRSADSLREAVGASEVAFLIADFSGRALVRLDHGAVDRGRARRLGRTHARPRDGGARCRSAAPRKGARS